MHGKSFTIVLLSVILMLGFQQKIESQQSGEDDTEEMVNLGPISYSTKFELPPKRNYIIFKIRNNTPQTISNIFGWVYHYQENENKVENLRLVNNPHRGGIIVEGKPHLSQEYARWRFPISPPPTPPNPEDRYILRTHAKGIFFSNHSEPHPKKTEAHSK